MNNDLISREALKNYTREVLCADSVTNTSLIRMFDEIIDNAPTVEINTNDIEHKAYCKGLEDGKKIASPQGEWIYIGQSQKGLKVVECTNCHKRQYGSLNYCGTCGAKMKGGEEE